MSATVNLRGKFYYFHDPSKLKQLNDIIQLHSLITPNILIMATGCSFKQATQILLLLFELDIADCFVLIYLKDDPEVYIAKRSLFEGLPSFPYSYDYNAKTVPNASDVIYGFEFKIKEKIVFKSSNDE
jgi:hypothetical protein